MNIRVNSKNISTERKSLWKIRDDCYKKNVSSEIIMIVNGFQTDEDMAVSENDEITFIRKGEMPEKDELEAMMAARHTPQLFEKFKNGRVAVAGLGGLGSNIAIMLARSGVGHLHLIDFDVIEPSNLNRQQYMIAQLGMNKCDALKEIISQINPFIEVVPENVRVTQKNVKELFEKDDIVCEAFDNPQAKAVLVNEVLTHFQDKMIVAASGMAGIEDSNMIRTRKITDKFFICGDEVTDARPMRGLMAPRVGICAGHQANMVLRLLAGYDE